MTTTAPKPRRTLTARERAQQALDVAQRRLKRLESEKAKHDKAARDLTQPIADAKATRDYRAADPALGTRAAQTDAVTGITGTP